MAKTVNRYKMRRYILTYSSVVKSLEQTWRHVWTSVHGKTKGQIIYGNIYDPNRLKRPQQYTIIKWEDLRSNM